ncbi:zinc finger protein 213-like [Crotalus tigris]|uniref:zinc finger protein 213-like n=1 Tax=Crotalus tigris TaxID=88082 RepID=UPI00192F314C|nr:zinc finger protein 213-like [Crotalus tigris]
MEREAQERLYGPGKDTVSVHSSGARDLFQWAISTQEEGSHCLKGQWQEYLKTVLRPISGWGALQWPDLTLWDELASFDFVTDACQWSQEGMSHLLPTFRVEAQQILNSLNAKGDHRKIKTICMSNNSSTTETQRQCFRHFLYQEAEGPHKVCSRLWELCHRWLEPESRTKEQILELLILEQFLIVLPKGIQSQVRERGPETCAPAVALAEGFLLCQQENLESEPQESDSFQEAAVNLSKGQQAVSDARQRLLAKEVKKHDNGKASLLGKPLICKW